MMVDANTRSPGPFSAGVLSPVRACWSIMAMPSATTPSTGTTSPVFTTITSPCCSVLIDTCTSNPSFTSQTYRGCLPNTFSSIFLERSSVRRTSVRPSAKHQHKMLPGKICIVDRQPTTTSTSSTSHPSRFSLKINWYEPLKQGIDVYANTAAATGNSGGKANCAAAASGMEAVQMGSERSSLSSLVGISVPASTPSRISTTWLRESWRRS